MFLDLAALSVEEFSSQCFKHLFGEFIYYFGQEKNIQVAQSFVKHLHTFRKGLNSGAVKDPLIGFYDPRLEDIVAGFFAKFGPKSHMFSEQIKQQLDKIKSDEF